MITYLRRFSWLAATLIAATLIAGPAYAATPIDVTTTDDELDEATCTSADPADYGGAGDIALREAICISNNGGASIINLAPDATYVLSIAGTDEDANLTGDLDILADVTINGNDATVDANQIDRVFHIPGAARTVVMNDLTVTGGLVQTNLGPSISFITPQQGDYVAGTITVEVNADDPNDVSLVEFTIFNTSVNVVDSNGLDGWSTSWDTTTVADGEYQIQAEAIDGLGLVTWHSISVEVDNSAPSIGTFNDYSDSDNSDRVTPMGGGIWNAGDLTLNSVTVNLNIAENFDHHTHHGSAPVARGGGIFSTGPLTINDSVISNNSVRPHATSPEIGSIAVGGGIFSAGTTLIDESDILGNTAQGADADPSYTGPFWPAKDYGGLGEGGGIFADGETTITNSTLNNNQAIGGNGSTIGNGGAGIGGGLATEYGTNTLNIQQTVISGNQALGGIGGTPGPSWGGGLAVMQDQTATTLNGVTVTNNTASGQNGGPDSSGGIAYGGGIYNNGDLIVTGGSVNNNTAQGGAGGPIVTSDSTYARGGLAFGGGITSQGDLTLDGVEIAENVAYAGHGSDGVDGGTYDIRSGAPGGFAEGGGIAAGKKDGSDPAPTVLIQNNTVIRDNTALGGNGGNGGDAPAGEYPGDGGRGFFGNGGGIMLYGANATISDSAITGNTAQGGNGGAPGADTYDEGGERGGEAHGGGIFAFEVCRDSHQPHRHPRQHRAGWIRYRQQLRSTIWWRWIRRRSLYES